MVFFLFKLTILYLSSPSYTINLTLLFSHQIDCELLGYEMDPITFINNVNIFILTSNRQWVVIKIWDGPNNFN